VPSWLLLVLNAVAPIVLIFLVTIILVPGATVPRGTPKSLIWKRKLWELHIGWLGLGLSLVLAWFFTQGMKNMFGKPRPDLLARCEPDTENAANFVVGGFAGENTLGRLYSARICQNSDSDRVDDGFRSYPSGHASSAAAGLVYLSLFLASKFAVTIPFAPSASSSTAAAYSAFPSRDPTLQPEDDVEGQSMSSPTDNVKTRNAAHNAKLQSVRRQAAAPPLYLLAMTLIPFGTSVFIAASRWWDFRHHGFDILFGWLMGFVSSIYAFRYYHLSIQDGAGWAWGPRSHERAFWAGVGRVGYAEDSALAPKARRTNHRTALSNGSDFQQPSQASQAFISQRQPHANHPDEGYYPGPPPGRNYAQGPFSDVEMERMDHRI
jgi:membrane-associated phospholipid phosphatase